MTTLLVAVALCVASAVAYAVGASLQARLAGLPRLAANPRWWAALAANGVGAVLHLIALRYGPLSLVQPLGVLTLVFAVRFAPPPRRRGVSLAVAGLLGLLLVIGTPDRVAVLRPCQMVTLLLVTAAVVAALVARAAVPGAAGLWAAAAGGISFGVGSAVSQTAAVLLTAGGSAALAQPTVGLAVVAVVVLSTVGVLCTQWSYRSGLSGPLAMSTLANPASAAAIGVALLGERLTGGVPGALLAVVCAVVAAVGVCRLTAAPTLGGYAEVDPLERGGASRARLTATTSPVASRQIHPAELAHQGPQLLGCGAGQSSGAT